MTEELNHSEEVQQPNEEIQQSTEEVQQTIEETQPIEEIQQPVEEMQPAEEIQQPTEEMQPAEETQQPIEELQQSIEETRQSIEETQSPESVQNTNEEEKQTEPAAEGKKTKRYVREDKPKLIPNTDDFNWDELGKDKQVYSETERKKMEDVYSQTFNAIVEQDVVEGTIVAKNDREIVVNIGFKSDGVIPANELRYLTNVKIGDKVDVYVESQEDSAGQLLLSHKKAQLLKSWERVNTAHDKGEVITGHVKSKTKGGLIVDVFGIEAFLPGSQIDVKPIRDYDVFVDKTMEFKIVKINHEFKNIVVSHKALIESELEAQRAEIMAGLEKGQILEGIVKNITNYGAFIDLGGVDGLIHITDLSWGRITDPKEALELDQKVNVVILDFDESKKRIALGLKQLTPHPWDALDSNLKVGDKISGKVVVLADYGAFIEVLQGVEGLIHVSEMSWSQHLRTAQDFLKIGEVIDAIILTLDREERKMSLGIKQLIPDPWITISEKYPIGSRHFAIVRNFTNFGIFVELEEGVDGLIHISDLSWSKKIKHPAEFTKIGERIDVVILEMDAESRRLSLGHKQLEENPWDVFETIYTPGSIHQGTVCNLNDKGAGVILQGVEGFTFIRGLLRENGTTIKNGETEEFKVIEFSKEGRRIVMSHAKIWQDIRDAEREANEENEKKTAKDVSKATRRISDNIEKTTLGDLDALINLKADLEKEENKTGKAVKTKKVKAERTETIEFPQDPVEKPLEEKPAEEKPMEEKPAEEKPTEEKPTEEKPTEEKPMEEKPAEEKPKKTRTRKEITKKLSTEEPVVDLSVEESVEEKDVPVEKPKKTRAKKEETNE